MINLNFHLHILGHIINPKTASNSNSERNSLPQHFILKQTGWNRICLTYQARPFTFPFAWNYTYSVVAIELSNNQAWGYSIQTADGGGLSAFDGPQWRSPLANPEWLLKLDLWLCRPALRSGTPCSWLLCSCHTVNNSIQSIVCPDCTSRYGYCRSVGVGVWLEMYIAKCASLWKWPMGYIFTLI